MAHFVGLDVSVERTEMVCVVDDAGKVIWNRKYRPSRTDIIALTSLGVTYGRIGIEAGPLSQWLVNALTAANLPVICVRPRGRRGGCADLPCDGRPAATLSGRSARMSA